MPKAYVKVTKKKTRTKVNNKARSSGKKGNTNRCPTCGKFR